jgi:hypothetical protein
MVSQLNEQGRENLGRKVRREKPDLGCRAAIVGCVWGRSDDPGMR